MDQSTVKCIRRGVRINSMLGYLPYSWSDKDEKLVFIKSLWKRVLFYAQILLYWSFIALKAVQSIYFTFINTEDVTISIRSNLHVTAIGHCTITPYQLCTQLLYRHHPVVINPYLLFREQLRPEWNGM